MKYNKYYRNYLIRKYLICPILQVCYTVSGPFLKSMIYDEDCVFIMGMSRSGSTFLTDSVNTDNFFKWVEGPLLFEPFFYFKSIDHKNDLSSLSDHFKMRFGVFVVKLLRWFFIKDGQIFLNKHPENIFRLEAIRKYFPRAKFIITIRDPISVVASHVRKTKNDKFRHNYPNGQFPKQRNWRNFVNESLIVQFTEQYVGFCDEIEELYKKHNDIFILDYGSISSKTLARLDNFIGRNLVDNSYYQEFNTSERALENVTSEEKKFIYDSCMGRYNRLVDLASTDEGK